MSSEIFHYYAVGIGERPGVYHSWPDCEEAIGDRNPPYPQRRPQWRKFRNRQDAVDFYERFSNERREDLQAQNVRAQQLELVTMQNSQSIALLTQEVENLRREQQAPQDQPLDEALNAIGRQLGDGPDARAEEEFRTHYNLTYKGHACVVYTNGAFFRGGPQSDSSKAGVGVWFGVESKMNIGMGYVNNVRRSKRDAEALAVLIALHTAKQKGIRVLRVHCRSEFLRQRVVSRDASGASHFILTKLIKMLQSFRTVRLVICPASARGAKEAKKLAEANS